MSTVLAIYHGNIIWIDPMSPGPFSLLAMFHQMMSSASTLMADSSEALALHLRVTEGTGVSDTDVASATKLVLFSPTTIDILGKMIGVQANVLAYMGGTNCLASKTAVYNLKHMSDNEMVYRNLANSDPTFPLCYACLIDKRYQQYFQNCKKAPSPEEVDETPLAFDFIHQSIIDGTFTMNNVPAMLLSQLNKKPSATIPTGDPEDTLASRRERGRPVKNNQFQAKWRLNKSNIGFFVNRLKEDGPVGHDGKGICLHYHGEGKCRDSCLYKSSHVPLKGETASNFTKWFNKTMRRLKGTRGGDGEEPSHKKSKTDDDSDGNQSS